jgi:hypothetical protein
VAATQTGERQHTYLDGRSGVRMLCSVRRLCSTLKLCSVRMLCSRLRLGRRVLLLLAVSLRRADAGGLLHHFAVVAVLRVVGGDPHRTAEGRAVHPAARAGQRLARPVASARHEDATRVEVASVYGGGEAKVGCE